MFYYSNIEKFTPSYVYISYIECLVVICFTNKILIYLHLHIQHKLHHWLRSNMFTIKILKIYTSNVYISYIVCQVVIFFVLMILVPFKNGWTDLTKLLCVGSVSVREKLFGRKKPNLVSGFAGKTRQNWIIMIFRLLLD